VRNGDAQEPGEGWQEVTEDIDRDTWLARRRQYLGASDAAAALGMSPYTSRLQLCQDKWGERADLPSAIMERGTVLEDVVAELYRRRTGHATEPGVWCVSPEYPWMAASIDLTDVTADAIVQIKTVSDWGRQHWGDAKKPTVPTHIMLQCQHELIVTLAPVNFLVALFADESAFRGMVAMRRGGFRVEAIADHVEALIADDMAEMLPPIAIHRDERLISDLIEGEREFWNTYVLPHVSPPDASIPQTSPDILDADAEQTETLRRLAAAKADERAALDRYAVERCKVETYIGEHSGIVAPGVAKISYKAPAPRTDTDWRAVARDLAEWSGADLPEPTTWQSIAQQLGLDAGDDLYNTAVETHTETTQGGRVFRPRFAKE
jgi:putative phage-type endonuclease